MKFTGKKKKRKSHRKVQQFEFSDTSTSVDCIYYIYCVDDPFWVLLLAAL